MQAAALSEPFGITGCRCGEADLVEARWMEQVRNRARLPNGLVEEAYAFFVSAVLCVFLGDGLQRHLGGCEILTDAVVQFARKLAPLVVPQLQEPGTQAVSGLAAGQRGLFRLMCLAFGFRSGIGRG